MASSCQVPQPPMFLFIGPRAPSHIQGKNLKSIIDARNAFRSRASRQHNPRSLPGLLLIVRDTNGQRLQAASGKKAAYALPVDAGYLTR